MLKKTAFLIICFLTLSASSSANQEFVDPGWSGPAAMLASPVSPAQHSVHILDNFSLLETLEERAAAQHLLHGLATEIPQGGSILLATPYFLSVNMLAFLESPFMQNIQGVASPHFHIETLGLLHTINHGISFAIAHLVRAV